MKLRPTLMIGALSLMLMTGCSEIPKTAPLGIEMNRSGELHLDEIRAKLGKESDHYPTFKIMLGTRIDSEIYLFNSKSSINNFVKVKTYPALNNVVGEIEIQSPRTPRTLGEVREAWGAPDDDGIMPDTNDYYTKYTFEQVQVFVYTKAKDSDLITRMSWGK